MKGRLVLLLVLGTVLLLGWLGWGPEPDTAHEAPREAARSTQQRQSADCPDLTALEEHRDRLQDELEVAVAALEAERELQVQREGAPLDWGADLPAEALPEAWKARVEAVIASELPTGAALHQLSCDEAPCLATVSVPVAWKEGGDGIITLDEINALSDHTRALGMALEGSGEPFVQIGTSSAEDGTTLFVTIGVLPDGLKDTHPDLAERLRYRVELESGDVITAAEEEAAQ
jgi:hypothetical protein